MIYIKIRLLLFVLMITILITGCDNSVISDIEDFYNLPAETYLEPIE